MTMQLIIQHPDIKKLSLTNLANIIRLPNTFSGSVLRIDVPETFRLPENIAEELTQMRADFAVLKPQKFSDLKLIVSDMDSTLINIECIDEIAAGAGLKDKVSAITERAMRGELDFEASLRSRVALLKGLPESHLTRVYQEVLQLNAGAEYLLQQCHEHNVRFVLVSGGFTFFTNQLKQRLNFAHAYANELEIIDGKLTGKVLGNVVDAQTKKNVLLQHQQELNAQKHQIVAIGDGANDIPMLQAAGLGIAYHAKPKTQQAADVAINFNGLEALRGWFI